MTYGKSNGHVTDDVTLKGQSRDPKTLRASKTAMPFSNNRYLLDSLL